MTWPKQKGAKMIKTKKHIDLLDGEGYQIRKIKDKPITSDLFGVTNCEDCNGTGQSVDKAPQGVTYELYEDCETCNGLGTI